MAAPKPEGCDSSLEGRSASDFFRDARGSTAVEYALIGGLIFLAIFSGVTSFGVSMNKLYSRLSTTVASTN